MKINKVSNKLCLNFWPLIYVLVSGNAKPTEKMGEAFLGIYQVLNLFLLKPANTAIARVNSRKKAKSRKFTFRKSRTDLKI